MRCDLYIKELFEGTRLHATSWACIEKALLVPRCGRTIRTLLHLEHLHKNNYVTQQGHSLFLCTHLLPARPLSPPLLLASW